MMIPSVVRAERRALRRSERTAIATLWSRSRRSLRRAPRFFLHGTREESATRAVVPRHCPRSSDGHRAAPPFDAGCPCAALGVVLDPR